MRCSTLSPIVWITWKRVGGRGGACPGSPSKVRGRAGTRLKCQPPNPGLGPKRRKRRRGLGERRGSGQSRDVPPGPCSSFLSRERNLPPTNVRKHLWRQNHPFPSRVQQFTQPCSQKMASAAPTGVTVLPFSRSGLKTQRMKGFAQDLLGPPGSSLPWCPRIGRRPRLGGGYC